jgi:hypothetical protein
VWNHAGMNPAPESPPPYPLYIRLPPWGEREPFTGLTRTALDGLTRPQALNNFRPPVRSKIFRATGQKSGIKLIDFQSLRQYLDSLGDVDQQTEAKEAQ